MAFEAGAVTGKLGLDTSGFTGGILQAQGVASLVPEWATGFLVNPLIGWAQAAGAAARAVASAIAGTAGMFDDMGEAAEKAGVSVEFFSAVGSLAADAGASAASLGTAMKFLGNNVADADAGNKKSQKTFADLGITVRDASGAMKSNEQLFLEAADAIAALESPAQKTDAAMKLFGRSGTDLIPMLNMGSEGIKRWRDDMDAMGATVTDKEQRVGSAFSTMQTYITQAWSAVEQAIATPILEVFADHMDTILPAIVKTTVFATEVIGGAFYGIGLAAKAMWAVAEPVLGPLWEMLKAIASAVSGALGGALGKAIGEAEVGYDPYAAGPIPGMGHPSINVQNVNVGVDARESANQVGGKFLDAVRQAQVNGRQTREGDAMAADVAATFEEGW
jgi:hypothetical protein